MAAPTYKNATNVALSDTGTATSPSDTSIGDLVIIGVWSQNTSIPTHTIQSGFTAIRTHSHNDGTTDGRLSVACKVATASGAQSYQPYSVTGAATGQTHAWIITLTSGTWANWPLASLFWKQGSSTLTTTGVPNPPSVTGLFGDWLVLAIGAWHVTTAASKTCTSPTNYTERIDGPTASSVTHGGVGTRALTSLSNATEDPGGFTDSFTPNGSVSMTIAIPGTNVPVMFVAANSTGALPTGAAVQDIIVAQLGDTATIGTYSGWTALGTEISEGGYYYKNFYRVWQTGDTIPTWGTGYVTCSAFRFNHQTQAIVAQAQETDTNGASPTLPDVVNSAQNSNTAIYLITGNGTGAHTPPANYLEAIDVGNDGSVGYRTNLASGSTTNGTLTAAANNHYIWHFIVRQVDNSALTYYTLQLTSATFSETSTSINLLRGRKLQAESATMSETASTVNLSKGRRLSVDSSAVSWVSSDITLKRTYKLQGVSASVAMTPIDVSLEYGRKLRVDPATIALTPTAVNLLRGLKLRADTSAMAWTSTAINLKRTYMLQAVSASASMTPTTENLLYGRKIRVDPASILWTSTDINLTYQQITNNPSLSVDSATFSITGGTVNLLRGLKLSVTSATINETGTAVNLLRGLKLRADVASTSITPTAINLLYKRKLSVTSGSFSMVPSDVTLSKGVRLSVDSSAMSWSSTSVNLTRIRKLAAVSGTFNINSGDVTFIRPVVSFPYSRYDRKPQFYNKRSRIVFGTSRQGLPPMRRRR